MSTYKEAKEVDLVYWLIVAIMLGLMVLLFIVSGDLTIQIATVIFTAIILFFVFFATSDKGKLSYILEKKQLIVKKERRKVTIPLNTITKTEYIHPFLARISYISLAFKRRFKVNDFSLGLANIFVYTNIPVPENPEKSWLFLINPENPKKFLKELKSLR